MAANSADVSGGEDSMVCNIAVVIALGIEKASLQTELDAAAASPLSLAQSGPGADAAARAARAAIDAGATALVSWGLAGGLEPQIAPGTVVIPHRLVTADGASVPMDADWRARLVSRLSEDFNVHEGDVFVADRVLGTPRAKARAALETGGVAVDMESAAVAAAAVRAGLPVVTVRVVADCLTDTLPAHIDQWIGPTGRRRAAPIVKAIFRPSQWRNLIRLARRYKTADRVLTRLAQRLVPSSFEFARSRPL